MRNKLTKKEFEELSVALNRLYFSISESSRLWIMLEQEVKKYNPKRKSAVVRARRVHFAKIRKVLLEDKKK